MITMVLVTILLMLALCLTAVSLYTRWLFKKPVTPPPYNTIEDFGLRVEQELDASNFQEKAARCLIKLHETDGFWATYFEIPFAADERYNLSAMWRDILHDPDLRWLVVCLGLPTLLLPRQKPVGFSNPFSHLKRFNCREYSTFFAALILEQMMQGLQNREFRDAALRERLIALLHLTAQELVAAARFHPDTGATMYCFTEDPKIFNPQLNRLLQSFYSSYYDTDSYLVVGVLAAYQEFCRNQNILPPDRLSQTIDDLLQRHPLELLDACLQPVHQHAFPREQKQLPPELYAYVTYITAGANDVDPGVNVDILSALIQNHARWPVAQRPATLAQIAEVLKYLHFLATTQLLFTVNFHAFYSPTAFAFLWRRYINAYQSLPAAKQKLFDPEQLSEQIETHLRAHWDKTFFSNPSRPICTVFDLLLLAHAFPEQRPLLTKLIKAQPFAPKTPVTVEFLSVVYPLRWLFGSPALTFALMFGLPAAQRRPEVAQPGIAQAEGAWR